MPKKVSRKSLAKAGGSNMPMNGRGARGGGAKLKPVTGGVKWTRKSLLNVKSNPTRGLSSPTRNIKRT
jgi:hypothetical protein